MPIYGYACKQCGHTLDALQKMADDPLVDCPDCGEPELKRQLSAPRFRLKGQGWYETDFKKDNQRNLAGDADKSKDSDKAAGKTSETTAGKTPDKKADKKTDKKPDKKPASKTGTKKASSA